jgi:hypothetical protein
MDKEFDVVIVVGGRSGCGSPAWSENGSPYSASAIAGGDGSRQRVRTNWQRPAIRESLSRKRRRSCMADMLHP